MCSKFNRLIRFVPQSNPESILIGEPIVKDQDVGLATYENKLVEALVFSGKSVLEPGTATDKVEAVKKLLSPLEVGEVGTIRCIGLNYHQHANEVKMAIPDIPVLFMKPATALGNPYPEPVVLPFLTQKDDCGDFESEVCVVIGKSCKNVSESEALDHVLGYTASNDISSRAAQFAQSQWCFSKGFDGSCPIGPCIVSTGLVPNPGALHIRGLKNGKQMQNCSLNDLIFSVPKIVSFLSQGTTLLPGTIILTGTPAGVGMGFDPKEYIREGDNFAVEILPHIGTLISTFENEK
ncbi:hypothetical protein BJ878DRAFT_570690 [Calycina marina]|uniref:Fumarylacetoacetase-like C-terminal domain-containing protein n=1 Tax=Calycina marina TaxID=1763456 RepID=A0A9P7YWU1_9HELO|nr:hypothetical protein BJ878DRAFT_570690 [Calycina marina]